MPSHCTAGRPAQGPVFVTQQRPVRAFLADPQPVATICSEWLYRFGHREPTYPHPAAPAPAAAPKRRVTALA